MFADNPNTVRDMIASRFIFVKSGTYHNQAHRHFDTTLTNSSMSQLLGAMDHNQSSRLSESVISAYAPDIVSVAVDNQSMISLPHGWGSQRGIFMLQFRVTRGTGAIEDYAVQGYTDMADQSFSGALSPDMVCYVNNVVITSPFMQVNQATGMRTESHRYVASFQPVMDHAGMNAATGFYGHLMRPRDVVMATSVARAPGEFFNKVDLPGSHLSNGLLATSSKSNNIPTAYVAKIFNNFAKQVDMPDQDIHDRRAHTGSSIESAFADQVLPYLRESGESNMFLRKLGEIAAGRGTGTAVCRYQDLKRMFPNLEDHNVGVRLEQGGSMRSFSQQGDTEHWQGRTMETKVAIQIASIVPALVLENMAHTVVTQVSNASGRPVVQTRVYRPFTGDDGQRQKLAHSFDQALLLNLFNQISHGGSILVDALIEVMIYGEIKISLSIEGRPATVYVAPCFCDSLMTPVYTPREDIATNFNNTIRSCMSDIIEGINSVNANQRLNISKEQLARASTPMKHFEGAFTPPPAPNMQGGTVPFPAQQPAGRSSFDSLLGGSPSANPVHQPQPGRSSLDELFNRH